MKIKNKISSALEELFYIEIANEHLEETGQSRSGTSAPGGVNPATLGSTLDSVESGLEVDSSTKKELVKLVRKYGHNTEVRKFI